MSRTGLLSVAFCGALGIAATPSVASAQGYAPPPPPPPGYYAPPAPPPMVRTGFTLGVGLGIGSLHLSDSFGEDDFGSGFFELHLGGMISPRLALLVELWGSSHSNNEFNDEQLTQGNAGVALQGWVSPRLWLKGGIGSSRLEASDFGSVVAEAEGAALLLAVGYELLHHPRYALDLQFRTTFASYGEDNAFGELETSSGSLQIGFSWY